MRTVPKDLKSTKIKCESCGFETMTESRGFTVGDRLIRYDGGGDYGFCGRCKRTNTMIVIEVPQPKQVPARGWVRVPEQ